MLFLQLRNKTRIKREVSSDTLKEADPRTMYMLTGGGPALVPVYMNGRSKVKLYVHDLSISVKSIGENVFNRQCRYSGQ